MPSEGDMEFQRSVIPKRSVISVYKVPLILAGVVVIAAISVMIAYSKGLIGKADDPSVEPPEPRSQEPSVKESSEEEKSTTKPPPPEDPEEILKKQWEAVESCKYSELTPVLKDFVSKNKAAAPTTLQVYVKNMKLYEFANLLIDDKVIGEDSDAECKKILKVEKVMNLPFFDLSDERKRTVRMLVRKCKRKDQPLDFEKIKQKLSQDASPEMADLEGDEDLMENFVAIGKLKDDERDGILGSAVGNYNKLLKSFLAELSEMPEDSPKLQTHFSENSELLVQCLNSPNLDLVLGSVGVFCQYLHVEEYQHERLTDVVDLMVIPRLVSFLTDQFNAPEDVKIKIINETEDILSEITAGISGETAHVVSAGAIPVLLAHVLHSDANVRAKTIRILRNIALDCDSFRHKVLETELLQNLLEAVNLEQSAPDSDIKTAILRHSANILRILCAQNGISPKWTIVSQSIPILELLLQSDDEEMLKDATKTLCVLAKYPNKDVPKLSSFLDRINQINSHPKVDGYIGECCKCFVEEMTNPRKSMW